MEPTEPGGLLSVSSRSHWLKMNVSIEDHASELYNHRDEHSGPKPASDAEETEGVLPADTWNPNLKASLITTFQTFHHSLGSVDAVLRNAFLCQRFADKCFGYSKRGEIPR